MESRVDVKEAAMRSRQWTITELVSESVQNLG
jgi:hypothetical protein